jgi:hypothetical protein
VASVSVIGGTRCSCSPERRSGVRLVTSSARSGAALSSSLRSGAASSTTSKLSAGQKAPRPEIRLQGLGQRCVAPFLQTECVSDRRGDEPGVAHVFEADEVHAVGEGIGDLVSDLEGEPRLAWGRLARSA